MAGSFNKSLNGVCVNRPAVGKVCRALSNDWRLPHRSFSIWDSCEQHRIIPLAPDRPRMLSVNICCGLPRFPPPLTVPCNISLANVLCLVV